MLIKTLTSILFLFCLIFSVQAEDKYSNHLISNYNFIMPGFDFVNAEDELDVLAFNRSESSSEVSTLGVNSQENTESTNEKIKEIPDENISSENSEEDNISDTVFQVGIFLLIAVTFGTMAFFLIRYMRRNK